MTIRERIEQIEADTLSPYACLSINSKGRDREEPQNARTIAKALRLNEDLVEAIALGHDLGHTPFGHAGEFLLNQVYEGGFRHNEQSVRIVEKLEKDGEGLNLTWEVRDGILNHQTRTIPHTLEGRCDPCNDSG